MSTSKLRRFGGFAALLRRALVIASVPSLGCWVGDLDEYSSGRLAPRAPHDSGPFSPGAPTSNGANVKDAGAVDADARVEDATSRPGPLDAAAERADSDLPSQPPVPEEPDPAPRCAGRPPVVVSASCSSAASTVNVSATFVNTCSDDALSISWLAPSVGAGPCNEHYYVRLLPGASWTVATLPGHRWIIRSGTDGRSLASVTIPVVSSTVLLP